MNDWQLQRCDPATPNIPDVPGNNVPEHLHSVSGNFAVGKKIFDGRWEPTHLLVRSPCSFKFGRREVGPAQKMKSSLLSPLSTMYLIPSCHCGMVVTSSRKRYHGPSGSGWSCRARCTTSAMSECVVDRSNEKYRIRRSPPSRSLLMMRLAVVDLPTCRGPRSVWTRLGPISIASRTGGSQRKTQCLRVTASRELIQDFQGGVPFHATGIPDLAGANPLLLNSRSMRRSPHPGEPQRSGRGSPPPPLDNPGFGGHPKRHRKTPFWRRS